MTDCPSGVGSPEDYGTASLDGNGASVAGGTGSYYACVCDAVGNSDAVGR